MPNFGRLLTVLLDIDSPVPKFVQCICAKDIMLGLIDLFGLSGIRRRYFVRIKTSEKLEGTNKGCGVAQMVVRRLDVRQARV